MQSQWVAADKTQRILGMGEGFLKQFFAFF